MTASFDILVQLLRSVRQTILLSHNFVPWKFGTFWLNLLR